MKKITKLNISIGAVSKNKAIHAYILSPRDEDILQKDLCLRQ